MKIAVPSADERGLDSEVSPHFCRTPFFTLVRIKNGENKRSGAHQESFNEHSPGDIPPF